jgi:hypothetical protein
MSEDEVRRDQMDHAWTERAATKVPAVGTHTLTLTPSSTKPTTLAATAQPEMQSLHHGDKVRWDRRKATLKIGTVIDPRRPSSIGVRFDDGSKLMFVDARELVLIPA